MIVVDSSVLIDMYRRIDNARTSKLRQIAGRSQVIVLDVVMLEVLQGARDDLHGLRLEKNLREFRLERAITVDLAVEGAQYSCKLRALGITIRKTVDIIIGTYCIQHDHQLLHNDRDFLPMVKHLGLKEY